MIFPFGWVVFILYLENSSTAEEYCISEAFRPECRQNEIISITAALFGRRHFGRCLSEDEEKPSEENLNNPKYIGCYRDVRQMISQLCAAERKCEVPIAKIKVPTTCHSYYKSYLEAAYICLKEEFCYSESFKPSCGPNEIIVIKEAHFGRINVGRCLQEEGIPSDENLKNSKFIGCSTDVKHIIDPICAGKQSCSLFVALIKVSTECFPYLKHYLEASYQCVKEEYCNSETFRPQCLKNEVVVVSEAVFGRKVFGRCLSEDDGAPSKEQLNDRKFVGCYVDVKHLVDPVCAGQQKCELPIAKIKTATSCHSHFIKYLEATYTCLKEEYCISETFNPKCSSNEVIILQEAVFGRRFIGRCLQEDESSSNELLKKIPGFIGCYDDVLPILQRQCAGLKQCSVLVASIKIKSQCPSSFVKFLEVVHRCVKEEYCNSELFQPRCRKPDNVIVIKEAIFGRRTHGKCLQSEGTPSASNLNDKNFIGCYADVSHIIEAKCAGREDCAVWVVQAETETQCHKYLKQFLEVQFECVQEEYCNSEIFQPKCQNNEIIKIEEAWFGRLALGRCLKEDEDVPSEENFKDLSFIGCSADVKNILNLQCAGEVKCEVSVAKIKVKTTCHRYLKHYLDVIYDCLQAEEYCHSESFQPHCSSSKQIIIVEAYFGRMQVGKCLIEEDTNARENLDDSKFVGCFVDVSGLIAPLCAGKHQCDISVAKLKVKTSCHGYLKQHLYVKHRCISGELLFDFHILEMIPRLNHLKCNWKEYCHSETFQPNCRHQNEVIFIERASFGRMNIGKCLLAEGPIDETFAKNPGYVGCSVDVSSIIISKCAGRSQCEVSVAKIEAENSCLAFSKSYLEVEYSCIKEEYCNKESFKPECSKNDVVQIVEALYGRKRIGRCLSDAGVPDEHLLKTPGFVGCYADVKSIIEPLCAGRMRCEVAVAQIDVDTHCSKHFRYYLEAKHRCLKEEYCISKSFQPRCNTYEIIFIEHAFFGRQKIGKCLLHEGQPTESNLEDEKFIGCYSDVKRLLGPLCNGKHQCDVLVAEIEEETNCHKYLKHYLEASYQCLKGRFYEILLKMLLILKFLLTLASYGASEEYCITDSFQPRCHKNEILAITEALFGRQKIEKCLKDESGSDLINVKDQEVIGCYRNVKDFIDSKCSGQPHCDVPIVKIQEKTPCHSYLKHYLEASYVCLKG
ncbi:hypothetical protein HELRODRAFT_163101 [Helobdella robusta]|uniref:SUEL-type lectin domain-containing protein n=1 Tax=Helobdella robusta TaxID=6412 RepID=T1ETN3_HELRO|nr:hypothetical protein HELRODRAFT_163101 [Helobdella robusta]ESN96071.1 hypothetical protein HELRODRAFT_163101 [Helobdella robusta]